MLTILAALQPYADLLSFLGFSCIGISTLERGRRDACRMLDTAKGKADEIMERSEAHLKFLQENVDELTHHELALKMMCFDLANRDPKWKSWDHVLNFYVQKARVYRREHAADSVSSPPSE